MKNITTIACLSFMLVTFACAEETPKTSGISAHDKFKLRQMYEDFKNDPTKDFSCIVRPNEICFRNNSRNEEVCVHTAILAEMILKAYKSGQAELLKITEETLSQFKQATLPEFNISFNTIDKIFQFTAATPTNSFAAEGSVRLNADDNLEITGSFHVEKHIKTQASAEVDTRNGKFLHYSVSMTNLQCRKIF